ncbi:phosphate acetyltransferase [Sedimentisphaera salicampi]|uniref:Phosphate acetyltransferase n=1 Tax=Sedimentisphaera salicampi TaxID=1941349 RepID=A0A1W6LJH7_9BACT|nr:phosphate acetyltransferase [Sedimentisphaera salicampi]ARN55912.1 Phosphate acetyltransferase [Sedimentisphaera salicampi]
MSETEQFLTNITKKAKSLCRHIVLPEGEDQRMVDAASMASKEKMAIITMLGDAQSITSKLEEAGAAMDMINVVNPADSPKLQEYAEEFYQLRKKKGIDMSKAEQAVKDSMYFGTMMLKQNDADGLVAGAVHSSADTIRPALQIVKCAPSVNTVSSMFFICRGEETYLFSDCGLNLNPTPEQHADIALATANTARQFSIKPRIAMLCYSTKGSGLGPDVDAMQEATKAAKEKLSSEFEGDYDIDGELQLDAAFVPEVAAKKAPESPLDGKANVFIFPDLCAGNIAYKLAERMGGMSAYGPILQGVAKPVNDLSRGCSARDILATIAITAIQGEK